MNNYSLLIPSSIDANPSININSTQLVDDFHNLFLEIQVGVRITGSDSALKQPNTYTVKVSLLA